MLREGPIRRWLRGPGKQEDFFDIEVTRLREEKRSQWKTKGYPDELIGHALNLAEGWTLSMAKYFSGDEAGRKSIILRTYPNALVKAENWIKAMMQ